MLTLPRAVRCVCAPLVLPANHPPTHHTRTHPHQCTNVRAAHLWSLAHTHTHTHSHALCPHTHIPARSPRSRQRRHFPSQPPCTSMPCRPPGTVDLNVSCNGKGIIVFECPAGHTTKSCDQCFAVLASTGLRAITSAKSGTRGAKRRCENSHARSPMLALLPLTLFVCCQHHRVTAPLSLLIAPSGMNEKCARSSATPCHPIPQLPVGALAVLSRVAHHHNPCCPLLARRCPLQPIGWWRVG